MAGLFSRFFEGYFEVSEGSEWVVRVLTVLTDPLQDRSRRRSLDIQLGIRLAGSPVFVSRYVSRRGHSVWIVLQGCQKHEKNNENHAPQP